jgi:hypothetical protein
MGNDLELLPPTIYQSRQMFHALKNAFYNYSEQFILHYLYRREQIQSTYSIEDLIQVIMPVKSGDQQIEIEAPNNAQLINVIYESGTPLRNGGVMTTTQLDQEVDRTLRCTTCMIHEESVAHLNHKESRLNLLELPDH